MPWPRTLALLSALGSLPACDAVMDGPMTCAGGPCASAAGGGGESAQPRGGGAGGGAPAPGGGAGGGAGAAGGGQAGGAAHGGGVASGGGGPAGGAGGGSAAQGGGAPDAGAGPGGGAAGGGLGDAGPPDAGSGCAPACAASQSCRAGVCLSTSITLFDGGVPAKRAVGPCEGGAAQTTRAYRTYWQDDFRQSAGLPDELFAVAANLPQINSEQQHYEPSQVTVAADGLHLRATRVAPFVAADGKTYRYRSGEVYSANKASALHQGFQTYGRWEVCAKLPTAQGSWPAVWLLKNSPGGVPGNNPWPPELDVMEHVGNLNEIQTNVFWGAQPNQQMAEARHPNVPVGGVAGFHLYAVEFDAAKIDYFVDGALIRSEATASRIPSEPMYLILNLAVGGVLPSYRPPCDAPTPGANLTCADGVGAYDAGVEMVVRYARAYQ